MEFLKKQGINLLVWGILAGMILVRFTSYGDLNLSVANADSGTYIQGGAAPLFARDMLTKSRLFTTNLLYYLADVQDCEIQAISFPAIRTETFRAVQPCFNRIVFFQNIFSIFAWSFLALIISKKMKYGFEKILAVSLITAFGFTPSIADWDSILGSESLTFSLFAVCAALMVEVTFPFAKGTEKNKTSIFINCLTVAALALWAFIRDANIYTLIVLLVLSISILAFPIFRKNKPILFSVAMIIVITIIGLQSASSSRRWEVPLTNVFNDLILPHPSRVEFMQKLGMPSPTSSEYSSWFVRNAPKAYARFLITHPGYALTSITPELVGIFSENIQPYFYSDQTPARMALIVVNDILHPKTHLILILDFLLMIGLLIFIFRRNNIYLTIWVWLGLWLFFSASLTLGVGYFADSIGITRHTLFAVEIFRLLLWIFLIVLFDHVNQIEQSDFA